MKEKRFESSSAVLRYFAAVLAIVAFAFLFGIILYNEGGANIRFADLYFNSFEALNIPHVYGFIAQLLTLFAGIFGVLVIVIEPLYDNAKRYGIIAGAVSVACGVIILLSKVLFCLFEGSPNFGSFHLYGTTIASGCLAIIAGGLNIWASFVNE